MYVVTNQPATKLIKVRVSGMWSMPTMADYSRELIRNAKALDRTGGCKRVLVDMSDYPIQCQDVAQAHIDALHYARSKMGARVAIVMTSSMSRLQTVRLAKATGHAFFEDEVAALAWLLGGVDKIGRLDRLADHALIYA